MNDHVLMSDALKDRLDEGMLFPTTEQPDIAGPARVQVLSAGDLDDLVEGVLISLEMREGIAHKVSFQVPLRDCQFLLEGTEELDVMVSLDAHEELSWTPLMSRARNWAMSDPVESMITLTVTKH
jgi:hypothetical protein